MKRALRILVVLGCSVAVGWDATLASGIVLAVGSLLLKGAPHE